MLLFFCTQLAAQVPDSSSTKKSSVDFSEDKTVKNEIGFDMVFFVNIFRQNFQVAPATLFSLSYNRELSDKYSLRSTISMGYTNYSTKTDTLPSLKNYIAEQDFKIGIARKRPCFRRWILYYGMDWEYQHGFTKEQSIGPTTNVVSITDNTTKIFMTGPGPFCGVIFFINPRVSLNIESNLNFLYQDNVGKTTNLLHPDLNSKQEIKGFTTQYNLPSTLFLNIKF